MTSLLAKLGRLLGAGTDADNARSAAGRAAAHAIVLHLHGLPISAINAGGRPVDGNGEPCQLPMPRNIEETMRFHGCLALAGAGASVLPGIEDHLATHGAVYGFCDQAEQPLDTRDGILAAVDAALGSESDRQEDEDSFLVRSVASRLIAHNLLAIRHLAAALEKTPVVRGEEACAALIEGCLESGPLNALPLRCPTDRSLRADGLRLAAELSRFDPALARSMSEAVKRHYGDAVEGESSEPGSVNRS